MNKLLSRNKKA